MGRSEILKLYNTKRAKEIRLALQEFIFSAAVQADLTWLAILGVLNSVLSAFLYLRVIVVMYMKQAEEPKPLGLSWPLGLAVALAALGTLASGLWPSPLLDIAQQAIRALLGT